MKANQVYVIAKGEALSLEEALIELAKNVNHSISNFESGGGLVGGVSISNWHQLDTNKTYYQAVQALFGNAPPRLQDENYFTSRRINLENL